MKTEATERGRSRMLPSKITNGEPPEWLLIGLNDFSKFIQLEPELTQKSTERLT